MPNGRNHRDAGRKAPQGGIKGTILYVEQVAPEHLDDLHSSEQILERLEGAVRGEGATL